MFASEKIKMGRHKPKKGGKVKTEQAPPSGDGSQHHEPGSGGHTPETELAMIIHHAAKDNLPELLTDFIEVHYYWPMTRMIGSLCLMVTSVTLTQDTGSYLNLTELSTS